MEWPGLLTSLLALIVGGLITYFVQRSLHELEAKETRIREAEARLRDDRRQIYLSILEPYTALLSEISSGAVSSETSRRLEALAHRNATFELKIVGSDEVVRSFNRFARYIMDARLMPNRPPGELVVHWAAFVLAIRRSIGDPDTTLDESDMIVDWVTDIENLYPELNFEKRLQDHAVLGAP